MGPDSHSSTSTTSHTLSAEPPHFVAADPHSAAGPVMLSTLSGSIHSFLQPPASLHGAALVLSKTYLDPLASTVIESQAARLQENTRKRKRGGERHAAAIAQPLKLNKIHLDGFHIEQVWQQARTVLKAAVDEVEVGLAAAEIADETVTNGSVPEPADAPKAIESDENGLEVDSADSSIGGESADEEIEEHGHRSGSDDSPATERHMAGIDEEDELEDDDGVEVQEESSEAFVKDPHGLNDGFFSIDAFNKVSTFLEQQDAMGDEGLDDDDEEEIDWTADPLDVQSNATLGPSRDKSGRSHGKRNGNQRGDDGLGESEDESEEDGPTFGDVDLDAPEGASEDGASSADEDDEMMGLKPTENTNEILYDDFFAPPARDPSRKKTRKTTTSVPKPSQERSSTALEESRSIQRTIDAVRRDLFEDGLSADEDDVDGAAGSIDPADPRSRRSTHERRQAKLAEQIRALEAANVAKREWTLSGEARAVDRPMNSLLEEDLDFERTGKPVPVITAAVSEDIEEMIKQRILAQNFDEVIRRRPDDLVTAGQPRRGRLELDDSKAQQSLAEIYEEEHMRKIDPDGHQDKRDAKLKKEHDEIEQLWTEVSARLDALTSLRYKPKPPKASITVVADVPTVAMEDARPTAAVGGGAELASQSRLAPQEIYKPGEAPVAKDEVVLKSGVAVAKAELTREEKLRRRRREKERTKKRLAGTKSTDSQRKGGRSGTKADVVGALKKGGVRVIDKKGELRNVDGQRLKEGQGRGRGGRLKL